MQSVPVKEVFEGKIVWEGSVEIFTLRNAKAKRCYAWGQPKAGGGWEITTVLENSTGHLTAHRRKSRARGEKQSSGVLMVFREVQIKSPASGDAELKIGIQVFPKRREEEFSRGSR